MHSKLPYLLLLSRGRNKREALVLWHQEIYLVLRIFQGGIQVRPKDIAKDSDGLLPRWRCFI
jgi:hypothetical protein